MHPVCKCSHVNKKALDQYTNFTEQREELARRQTENGRGEDKIKQLIQTLDMRKDEAIERTFKVLHAAQAGFSSSALHVASPSAHCYAAAVFTHLM